MFSGVSESFRCVTGSSREFQGVFAGISGSLTGFSVGIRGVTEVFLGALEDLRWVPITGRLRGFYWIFGGISGRFRGFSVDFGGVTREFQWFLCALQGVRGSFRGFRSPVMKFRRIVSGISEAYLGIPEGLRGVTGMFKVAFLKIHVGSLLLAELQGDFRGVLSVPDDFRIQDVLD